MTTRAFAAFMLIFSIGLIAGDWLWGGPERVREMLALRLAMGAGAVFLWWLAERIRSKRV